MAHTMKRDDSTLLAAVARGDLTAFEEIYRRHSGAVTGFLFRMTGNPRIVEELLNDVMLVVWRKAGTFAGRSRVSTWILGVAYRKALRAVRDLARRPSFVEVEPDMAVERDGPELQLADRERRDRVRAALAELSPEHRAVVELTFYGDLHYREIATIVGCPENTVKTRMFHARKRLREVLEATAGSRESEGKVERR